MTATTVVRLIAQKAVIFTKPEVAYCVLKDEVLIGVFHPGSGAAGALVLPQGSARAAELIAQLTKGVKSRAQCPVAELQAKLIGPAHAIEEYSRVLNQYGIEIKAACREDASVEVYFYTDTARLRFASYEQAPTELRARKRVLIVDDSKTIRQLLTRILSRDPALEVVGAAELPSQAERMIAELKPDVITLDINMPEMDGVTLLGRYIGKFPIPTVMISAISMEEGTKVLHALEMGAVDYIQKPSFEELDKMAPLIIEKVRTAASVKVGTQAGRAARAVSRLAGDASLNQGIVVAVGASTGGTEALRYFFGKLPHGIPPIVVVQHIPPVFSRAFANRLADLCPFEVKEAEDGDLLQPNRVLIAPGGLQMAVTRAANSSSGFKVKVYDGEPVNRHKPSVDVLFDSVAKEVGRNAIGIIFTGMGKDGAAGMLRMRQAGARTIAQDEASCVVFGMPKEAIKLGGAEAVHSLDHIPETLLAWLRTNYKMAATGSS